MLKSHLRGGMLSSLLSSDSYPYVIKIIKLFKIQSPAQANRCSQRRKTSRKLSLLYINRNKLVNRAMDIMHLNHKYWLILGYMYESKITQETLWNWSALRNTSILTKALSCFELCSFMHTVPWYERKRLKNITMQFKNSMFFKLMLFN